MSVDVVVVRVTVPDLPASRAAALWSWSAGVIGAGLEQGPSVHPLVPGELPCNPPVAAVARF